MAKGSLHVKAHRPIPANNYLGADWYPITKEGAELGHKPAGKTLAGLSIRLAEESGGKSLKRAEESKRFWQLFFKN